MENEIQALRIREADWVEHLNIFDELELKAGLVSIVRQWIIEYNAQVFHTKKIPQNKFIGEGGNNKPTSLIRSLCRPEIVEPEIKPKCRHPLSTKMAMSLQYQMTVNWWNDLIWPQSYMYP